MMRADKTEPVWLRFFVGDPEVCMSVARKGADGFLLQVMVLLCALWGFQQVAIKLAAPDLSTLLQVLLRSSIAALLVAALLLRRADWRQVPATWLPGVLAGALFALEFLFIALGLRHTTASRMAVFLYTSPIFSALALHLLLPSERLNPLQWLGIGLCFGGLAIAFGVGGGAGGAEQSLGDLFALLAGFSWGMSTVAVRCSSLSEAPPGLTLFYQLLMAAVLLLGFAVALGAFAPLKFTAIAVASVLFQGVVISGFSYFAWFWLLRRYLASQLAVLSFMTPLFGVLFGVLILDEPLTPGFVIGSGLVLAGISLVSGADWLRRRLSA